MAGLEAARASRLMASEARNRFPRLCTKTTTGYKLAMLVRNVMSCVCSACLRGASRSGCLRTLTHAPKHAVPPPLSPHRCTLTLSLGQGPNMFLCARLPRWAVVEATAAGPPPPSRPCWWRPSTAPQCRRCVRGQGCDVCVQGRGKGEGGGLADLKHTKVSVVHMCLLYLHSFPKTLCVACNPP